MEDKTEDEDQCGRNGRKRGTAQNNADRRREERRADTERKKTKRGTKRQRKRGKTLLTSTEGHREKEVTFSFFRIQESCLIWAWYISFYKNVPMALAQLFSASVS